MARYGFLQQFKSREPASRSRLCLRLQRFFADKVAFLKIDRPIGSGFDRSRRFIDIVPVKQITHLQTQEISCSEASGLEPFRLPRQQELPPKFAYPFRRDVELIAQFAAVACAGDEAGGTGQPAFTSMMQSEAGRLFGADCEEDVS